MGLTKYLSSRSNFALRTIAQKRRPIILCLVILISIVGVKKLSTFQWRSPTLTINRGNTIVDFRMNDSWPSVTKLKVSNTGTSTLRDLKLEIATDIYITTPSIIVNTLSKHSVEEASSASTIHVDVLPQNEFFVVTIFGILNPDISKSIAPYISKSDNDNLALLPEDSDNIPLILSVTANIPVVIATHPVNPKEILDQETKEGFAIHRFLILSLDKEQQEALEATDLIDVEVGPGDNEAIHADMTWNGKPFKPPFETPLVVLGAKDNKGKRIYYLDGQQTVSLSSEKAGTMNLMYMDILGFFYPAYTSTLKTELKKQGEN